MSRQTRTEWMEAHPWAGAAMFCAVVSVAMALYVMANGLSIPAAWRERFQRGRSAP